jgi:hypothetical protein
MKKTMALFTALTLAALFGCGKTEEGANSMVIQNYIGSVTIQGGGGTRLPEIGGSIAVGETIVTGGISSVDLVYNETALVRINENSSVRIDSVIAGMKKSTDLSMQKGSIFTTVSKLKEDENFRVSTPTMVIAVRGTSFRVSTDANSSDTDVLAGTVKVNPVRDGKVVTEVSNYVGENNRAEIKKDQVREILRSRKITIAAINAERMKRLRDDLNGLDGAVVDRLNPGLRKEFRMKLLQMKQDRFEMMESQRVERMQKFLEKKKQTGARIKARLLEKSSTLKGKKALLEKRREKKEDLIEKLREKKDELAEKRREKKEERAEKRREKKEGFIEKLRDKKKAADEKKNEKLEELKKKREESLKKRRAGN